MLACCASPQSVEVLIGGDAFAMNSYLQFRSVAVVSQDDSATMSCSWMMLLVADPPSAHPITSVAASMRELGFGKNLVVHAFGRFSLSRKKEGL